MTHAWDFRGPRITILFCVPLISSQDGDAPDDASGAMLAGQLGANRTLSGKLVGHWDVSIKFRSQNQWNDGRASCDAEAILDGRFVRHTYTSAMSGKPFTVEQTIGFNNVKNKFVELQIDNMNTGVNAREGKLSKDGTAVENRGTSLDPISSKTVKTPLCGRLSMKTTLPLNGFKKLAT